MREDPKRRAAIAEQQGRFFAMNTAASLTSHIDDHVKDSQILSMEALADIVWCYPALGVRPPPQACVKPAITSDATQWVMVACNASTALKAGHIAYLRNMSCIPLVLLSS
jgi:hypothetical protein